MKLASLLLKVQGSTSEIARMVRTKNGSGDQTTGEKSPVLGKCRLTLGGFHGVSEALRMYRAN
ncbi:hypothetical protein I7I48_05050 [Histoplasma ohiense]|nr:hypothetical protein I7I48_05050 [Histoplasma ohiense (nom. inval.)]